MTDDPEHVYALVPGAAVRPGGAPSPALDRRARQAAVLWHRGEVRGIILSGGIKTHPPTEAEVMAQVCRDADVPQAALFLEPKARTTEENMLFSRPILDQLGSRKVVITTDRYHAARALLVARRAGLCARASCPSLTGAPWGRVVRAWLREAVALGWYWLRGAGR